MRATATTTTDRKTRDKNVNRASQAHTPIMFVLHPQFAIIPNGWPLVRWRDPRLSIRLVGRILIVIELNKIINKNQNTFLSLAVNENFVCCILHIRGGLLIRQVN